MADVVEEAAWADASGRTPGEQVREQEERPPFQSPPLWKALAARRQMRQRERQEAQRILQEAQRILRQVTETAICRMELAKDGEMRDLTRALHRLQGLNSGGKEIGLKLDERGCQIINEVRQELMEAFEEVCCRVALPAPPGSILRAGTYPGILGEIRRGGIEALDRWRT